jgi:hypothetical protein
MRELQDWQLKMDHRLIRLLGDAAAAADTPQMSRTASVMLRFAGGVESLQELPCTLGTISGDVATAHVRLADVAVLARCPAILFIELAGLDSPRP